MIHLRCYLCDCRPEGAGQSNGELSELADLAVGGNRATMLLGHDVVADRKAEARPFAGGLRGEERLKELVFDLRWNANAIVADVDLNRITQISCRYLQGRLEFRVASLLLAFGSGVEAVAKQVET